MFVSARKAVLVPALESRRKRSGCTAGALVVSAVEALELRRLAALVIAAVGAFTINALPLPKRRKARDNVSAHIGKRGIIFVNLDQQRYRKEWDGGSGEWGMFMFYSTLFELADCGTAATLLG
jgi:hypothetical protein